MSGPSPTHTHTHTHTHLVELGRRRVHRLLTRPRLPLSTMKKKRADWNIIKAVKDHLDIPVLANGDIRHLADAKKCLEYTGCDGVLSAETLLTNPALFSEEKSELGVPDCPEEPCLMLLEYLDLCEKYPTPQRMVRAHVHKLLGSWFSVFPDVRQRMNNEVSTIELYRNVANEMIGESSAHAPFFS